MALTSFFIALAILCIEGWLLAGIFMPGSDRWLRITFALPLAAISNVLLFFTYTVIGVPLALVSLGIGHAIMIISLTLMQRVMVRGPAVMVRDGARNARIPHHDTAGPSRIHTRCMRLLCMLLLVNIFIFSFAHALLLHTFSIDSLTNWTMRSKISFVDRSMAFDPNENRGMSKPQYPFLTHALQIAANQGQREWNDRAANAITWLLSLSCFSAVFLLLKRLRGTDSALLTLTLIAGIPLLSIHLAQGYGDIHLVEYLLLALCMVAVHIESEAKPRRSLIDGAGSAIFVLGGMWTKSEGLFFGFAPWALILLLFMMLQKKKTFAPVVMIVTTFALFAPFLLLLRSKGLPFTPHETDAAFAWHPEGLAALWPSLFGVGSFGIMWYVLPIASVLCIIEWQKKSKSIDPRFLPLLLWGWLIVVENLFIYLFTPNVGFLLNGESFFRQMLPAAALIILACAFVLLPQPRRAAAEKKIPKQHPSLGAVDDASPRTS